MMAHSDRSTFTFKYMCDDSAVDLNTMLVSQMNFLSALNKVKDAVAPTKANFSAKIRPLTAGSVPFEIMLDISWMESLFDGRAEKYAERIIGVIASILTIKQALRGRTPKSVVNDDEGVTMESQEGTRIHIDREVYEMSQNKAVDRSISDTFKTIQQDEDINGVEIVKAGEVLSSIPASDFQYMRAPNPILDDTDQKSEVRENVLLIAKSIVFTEGKKWEFLMEGRKIRASFRDEPFFGAVTNSRVRFGHGDRFRVNLEIIYDYNPKLDAYEEKEFYIVKVLEHQEYQPPPELNFGPAE